MASTAGRSSDGRAVTITTTNLSAAVTAPAGTFHEEDPGRTVTAAGVPAGTTILSVESATAATLSANATASATVPATLGVGSAQVYGFVGWSPETDAESETYSIAGGASAAAPSRITSPTAPREQRSRA